MRKTLFAVLALLGASVVTAVACIDPDANFVYTAQPYDPNAMCLGAYVELEQVQATGGSPRCNTLQAPDSGVTGLACLVSSSGTVYVSPICPPYPPDFDTTGTNPLCAQALQAWATDGGCYTPPAEGGAPDDGSSDDAVSMDDAGADDAGSDATRADGSSDARNSD